MSLFQNIIHLLVEESPAGGADKLQKQELTQVQHKSFS